ncbi:hypothetical protein PHYPSEUDO_009851 [Phytophthora pseudosyringae]|uniref:Uncharacterized protein n=1 Tax=Phytophthora pseudosyringae TaxID=221518 RepID=A0A8T1WBY2_9STRA|nr:hypothetical protein PHYPSEUDO_009851 [Phytophthora pseudosyringae]
MLFLEHTMSRHLMDREAAISDGASFQGRGPNLQVTATLAARQNSRNRKDGNGREYNILNSITTWCSWEQHRHVAYLAFQDLVKRLETHRREKVEKAPELYQVAGAAERELCWRQPLGLKTRRRSSCLWFFSGVREKKLA